MRGSIASSSVSGTCWRGVLTLLPPHLRQLRQHVDRRLHLLQTGTRSATNPTYYRAVSHASSLPCTTNAPSTCGVDNARTLVAKAEPALVRQALRPAGPALRGARPRRRRPQAA